MEWGLQVFKSGEKGECIGAWGKVLCRGKLMEAPPRVGPLISNYVDNTNMHIMIMNDCSVLRAHK